MAPARAYALTDGSHIIEAEHLAAALAVWDYSVDTVRLVFGSATGDPVADKILEGVRRAGEAGLDGTQIRDLFGRHETKDRLEGARQRLEALGLVRTATIPTSGRPRIVTYAVATEETKATEGTPS